MDRAIYWLTEASWCIERLIEEYNKEEPHWKKIDILKNNIEVFLASSKNAYEAEMQYRHREYYNMGSIDRMLNSIP